MTHAEAKIILGAYRPHGQDAHDAVFAEAMRLAQRDPELAEWFSLSQGLDAAMVGKLRTLVPPPGLKEAILARGRSSI